MTLAQSALVNRRFCLAHTSRAALCLVVRTGTFGGRLRTVCGQIARLCVPTVRRAVDVAGVKRLRCQSEKLAQAIGDSDEEFTKGILDEDCVLTERALSVLYKLQLCDEDLVLEIESNTKANVSTVHESDESVIQKVCDMQLKLQHEFFAKQHEKSEMQMKMHQEFIESQKVHSKETVKLPKIDLISFNGNRLQWIEFWDSFESAVHENERLSPVDKFNYLKGKLTGEARSAIAGLTLSNENYGVAIKILHERFGDKQEIIDLHYKKLMSLEPAKNTTESLRYFLDTVERHLRSLEVLKENLDQHVFVSMIRNKLPSEVLLQLEILKGSENKWTVMKLRDLLRQYIVSKEKAEKNKPYETASQRDDKTQRSLCEKKFPKYASKENVHLSEEVDQTNHAIGEEAGLLSHDEKVLMQTALVEACGEDCSKNEKVRLILDSGSHRTYITRSLADRLGLKERKEEEIRLVTFGSEKSKVIKTHSTTLKVKLKSGMLMTMSANIVQNISGAIQRNPVNKTQLENLAELTRNLNLADTIPTETETNSLELLIGNDYYLDIIEAEKIKVGQGLYLLASKLGWILSGRTTSATEENQIKVQENKSDMNWLILTYGNTLTECNIFTEVDSVLSVKPDLEDFWNIESIGITDTTKDSKDEMIMQRFKETLKRENGRYQVTWPWKDDISDLPENYGLAIGRLKSLANKIHKQPELMKRYNEVIQDQLKQDVIERVDRNKSDGVKHYIPHHVVIKSQNETTKLRIVYDASAKVKKENKVSTNNYEDPQLEQRNIEEFRFRRVPFGVISSPFLLGATIEHHLDTYGSALANQLKEDIYMDNIITGTDTKEEAVCLYKSAKSMFGDAKMNLREWKTNSDEVNETFAYEDLEKNENVKVLGHTWNTRNDTVAIQKPKCIVKDLEITKRNVLKQLASVFDPLGLFSPVLLKGKVLIQKVWSKHLDWDESFDNEDASEWI
ncbi:uncharacterized protein LOC128210829 [Mya arenaria]|uniref:uncharacterized protein LOC128210829 n=1 Tax=Mya arenaria TaxID=6604 RepID=UPI0022DF15D4|nr:uncharacterized protein LOC128210829 [Mya arenaria]